MILDRVASFRQTDFWRKKHFAKRLGKSQAFAKSNGLGHSSPALSSINDGLNYAEC